MYMLQRMHNLKPTISVAIHLLKRVKLQYLHTVLAEPKECQYIQSDDLSGSIHLIIELVVM